VRDEDLLTSCLAELDRQNWDVEAYLATRPDLPTSVQSMLRSAGRVRALPKPVPSPEFQARISARLAAKIAADAERSSARPWFLGLRLRSFPRSWFRPIAVPIATALLVICGIGGVWTASAAALPGSAFYPTKLAAERVQLLLAPSPQSQAEVDLKIAQTRLAEAQTELQTGNVSAVPALLQQSNQALTAAQTKVSQAVPPSDRPQIEQKITQIRAENQNILPRLTPTVVSKPGQNGEVSEASNTSSEVVSQGAGKAQSQFLNKEPPTITPTLTARSNQTGNPSQSETLLRTLIQQAMANNASDALATARLYANALASEHARVGAEEKVNGQRAQLEEALKHVPASSRNALLLAEDALNSTTSDGAANAGLNAGVLSTATAGAEFNESVPAASHGSVPAADKAAHDGTPPPEGSNSQRGGKHKDDSRDNSTPPPAAAAGQNLAAVQPGNNAPLSPPLTPSASLSRSDHYGRSDGSSSGTGNSPGNSHGNGNSHADQSMKDKQTDQHSMNANPRSDSGQSKHSNDKKQTDNQTLNPAQPELSPTPGAVDQDSARTRSTAASHLNSAPHHSTSPRSRPKPLPQQ